MFDLLSIVVTGRNDAAYLDSLLRYLRTIEVTHEVLYFDLASTDDSVRIARRYTDKVFRIDDLTWRRSSGRWAGAVVAEFDWVLFLDADMMVQPEFIDFLNNRTYMHAESPVVGYVGSYHLQENGRRSPTNLLVNQPGSRRAFFEGALLIKKEPLLAVGNWMPSLYAHNHLDLRLRLAGKGYKIESLPVPMVMRLRPERSNTLQLLEQLLPINRNYLGMGQLVMSQIRHRSLLTFIGLAPWPWLLLFAVVFWPLYGSLWGGVPLALLLLLALIRRGPTYLFSIIAGIIRAPFGFFAYSKKVPHYKQL